MDQPKNRSSGDIYYLLSMILDLLLLCDINLFMSLKITLTMIGFLLKKYKKSNIKVFKVTLK